MNTTYDINVTRRVTANDAMISHNLIDNTSNVGVARSEIIRIAGDLVAKEGCMVIGIRGMMIHLRSADDATTIIVSYRNNYED